MQTITMRHRESAARFLKGEVKKAAFRDIENLIVN